MALVAYDQRWEKLRKDFEAASGKHRPKDAKGIATALGNHSGVSKALKACSAAHETCERTSGADVKAAEKAVKDFAAALKDFSKAKTGYLAGLGKAFDQEFAACPAKDAKSAVERLLKLLTKELDSLESSVTGAVGTYARTFDEAAQAAAADEKLIKSWEKAIEATLARAAAGVAKVRAKPTPETYNELFPALARDISAQLDAARKIRGLKAEPDFFKKRLAPWAASVDGLPVKVPPDYTAKQIIDLLKDFAAICKGIVQLIQLR
jgi:hypothetical protein